MKEHAQNFHCRQENYKHYGEVEVNMLIKKPEFLRFTDYYIITFNAHLIDSLSFFSL